MATASTSIRGNGDDALTIRRVPAEQRRAVLGLLLTGRPRPGEPAVDQFMNYAMEQNLSLEELWAAYRGPEPVSSVLIMPSAGRTAMTFLSPLSTLQPRDVARLVRAACDAQDPARLRLLQAILDPWQELERQGLLAAGFTALANLVYMQRTVDGPPAGAQTLVLDPEIHVSHWSDAARPRFAAAILASYQQTLDCPGLVGLRGIDDIIEGHMASGQFAPDLWFALSRGDEPVGVMLLSLLPQRRAVELVYLGLAPAWRGRGLGARLLQHGLALAHRHRQPTMLLAVDDYNKPAVKLYQSMGFVVNAKKLAMIHAM
jgi:ribosomal protein S18 acetylase RimI-like enzyme